MADVTIGDLELGDNPGDGDLFEVEQGGQSKRLTFAQIKAAATGETTLPVGAHQHWRIFIEDVGPSDSAIVDELRFRKDGADLPLDGAPSASREGHANNSASAAFDGTPSVWSTGSSAGALPAWLAYSFSEPVEVDEISLKAGDSQARADGAPTVFLVEYSDDGKNWTSVQSYTTSPWAVDETRLFDVPASYPVSYVPEAPEEGIGFVRKDKGWAPEKTVAGLQPSAALSETDRLTLSQAGYASGEYWRVLVHRNVEGSSSNLYITEIQFREQEGVPQSRVDETIRGYNVTSLYPSANAFDGDLSSSARRNTAGAPFGVGLARSVPWTVREIAIYYRSPSVADGRRNPGTFDIQVSSDGANWATVASVEGFVPPAAGWYTFSTASPAVERSASLSQLTAFLDTQAGGVPEAPADGKLYGRKDESWAVVSEGGGGHLAPWGGARIEPVATQNYPGASVLRFATAAYDTDGFWSDTQPNRLTVPAGVTRVRLYASVQVDPSDDIPAANSFRFYKNGGHFPGSGGSSIVTGGYNNPRALSVSDAVTVEEGDYFEVFISASQSFSLQASGFTWFAIEVLERSAVNAYLQGLTDVLPSPAPEDGDSLVFDAALGKWKPGVPVVAVNAAQGMYKPFRGALVKFNSDKSLGTTPVFPVAWDSAEYDTSDLWSAGSPGRFTIPAGAKKVRLHACIGVLDSTWASGGSNLVLQFGKNGNTSFVGGSGVSFKTGYANSSISISSPVLAVEEGDFFEVRLNCNVTGSITLNAETSHFAIEIVEAEELLP